jgi:transcriptional antiterminator RfaH
MNIFRKGWYLIYTKPRHEKKVYTQLAEMNIESLLPMTQKLRTRQNTRRYVAEPLFPSYVFIYLEDKQNYFRGIDLEGALYYVRTGKEIARVNEEVIQNVRLITSHGHDLEVSELRFVPGQKLVIKQGPFTGLACEVVHINNKEKLLVRVDLLQRNLLLNIPSGCLA